jgi:hypothetical protein
MATIQCQDKYLPDTVLTAFGNDLAKKNAKLQTPVNSSQPVTSKRTGTKYVLVLDPVVEFDETKISQADVEAVMAAYGFKERP